MIFALVTLLDESQPDEQWINVAMIKRMVRHEICDSQSDDSYTKIYFSDGSTLDVKTTAYDIRQDIQEQVEELAENIAPIIQKPFENMTVFTVPQ